METNELGFAIGRFEYKVDAKGRVTFPLQPKDCEPQKVYILINAAPALEDRCLICMNGTQFAAYYRKLRRITSDDPAFKLVRQILASVDTVTTDSTGKILVNKVLRDYAGIVDGTVMCPTENGLEIWSTERFERKRELDLSNESAYKAFARHMNEDSYDANDMDALRKQIEHVNLQAQLQEARNRLEKLNAGVDD